MCFSLSYATRTGEGNRPKCFASEKGIEGFAVCHVLLTGEKNPKSGAKSKHEEKIEEKSVAFTNYQEK